MMYGMLSVLLVTQIYLIISIQYYSHVKTKPMHQTGYFSFSLTKKNELHVIRVREEIVDKRKVCYGSIMEEVKLKINVGFSLYGESSSIH